MGGVNTDSQSFATEAATAGFDGIRYLVRHDPAQRLCGVALFGDPGAPHPADPNWPAGEDADLTEELIAAAAATFGYRALPPP